jgi:hypothetical protein
MRWARCTPPTNAAAYALYLSHVTQRLSSSAGPSGRRVNEARCGLARFLAVP